MVKEEIRIDERMTPYGNKEFQYTQYFGLSQTQFKNGGYGYRIFQKRRLTQTQVIKQLEKFIDKFKKAHPEKFTKI